MGHDGRVHPTSLSRSALRPLALLLVAAAMALSCGRKGDPVPRPRAAPRVCAVRMAGLRGLKVRLPRLDQSGHSMDGIERVRVYYAPLGAARPTAWEVLARGEVLLERSRPDLPDPGSELTLDLSRLQRPPGWLVVAAVRVGDVVGEPSEPLPWLDPAI